MKQYACKWYEGHMRNLKRSWKYFELNKNENQFNSVTQSCPTLYDPMDCSMPGLPVHHQLPGFTETHVHWVGDAIQSSHLLSSPSPSVKVLHSVQFSSVSQSCLTLCNTMNHSTPGSPVLHYHRVCSNSYPLSQWCYLTTSSLLPSSLSIMKQLEDKCGNVQP